LESRARDQKWNLLAELQRARRDLLEDYEDELSPIQSDYESLVDELDDTRREFDDFIQQYAPQMEDYQSRLESILDRVRETYSKLSTDLEQVDVDPEADEFRLPDPDLPPESDNQLYDSRRDYLDQLTAYKELRLNINGD
jgi:predicted nuclease with TOPRIM domain